MISPSSWLILPLFIPLVSSISFPSECFLPTFHRGVSNAQPITELWSVTAHDCLRYCILNTSTVGDACRSVVFHKHYSTCQLYGHDGTFNRSQIVYASAHDYYNRTSFTGNCWDRQAPQRDSQMTYRQYDAVQKSVSNAVNLPGLARIDAADAYARHPAPDADSAPDNPSDRSAEISAGNRTILNIQFPNPIFSDASCSGKDQIIGYFVFDGFGTTTNAPYKQLRGMERSSCSTYCTQNIEASGHPSLCHSMNYNSATEECRLYGASDKISDGSMQLESNTNMAHLNKFCISGSKELCEAEHAFQVHLQHTIRANAFDHSRNTVSVGHCMSMCVSNPDCKAIVFNNGFCELHQVSPQHNESLLIESDDATMVIENGCTRTSTKSGVVLTDWSAWSDCQFGVRGERVQVRSRDCGQPNCSDMQFQPCKHQQLPP